MKFAVINRVKIPILIENESSLEELESKKWSLKIGCDAEYVKGWSDTTDYEYDFTIKELKELVQTISEAIEMAEKYTKMRKKVRNK